MASYFNKAVSVDDNSVGIDENVNFYVALVFVFYGRFVVFLFRYIVA